MTDADLLRQAIDASGLSARRFAHEILIRDERTIRRWLAGDSPMPESVRDFLTNGPGSLRGNRQEEGTDG